MYRTPPIWRQESIHFSPRFFSILFTALLMSSLANSSEVGPTTRTASYTVISGNSTLLSPNGSFALGFFNVNGGGAWYLGIWYASIPIRTYVWVANRAAPARAPASAALTPDGRLAVHDSSSFPLWATDNAAPGVKAELLDTGNLVLLSPQSVPVWQSFDHPADTWLPEMSVTRHQAITSWRSPSDPSPGLYSLRLRPPSFGEFELVFNGSIRYWSTGSWMGTRFAGVPEMTVSYIYTFRFRSPFTLDASFVYSGAAPPDSGLRPLLTRFAVDPSGQLMQFTWSPQAASWETFWSRPESACRVYGRCGNLGLCSDSLVRPCECPAGLRADQIAWSSGDFSTGCTRDGDEPCGGRDGFQDVGPVDLDGVMAISFFGVSRGSCKDYCRKNCSCFGLSYNANTKICRNLYGSAYNLRNSTESPVLYIRVSASSQRLNERWRIVAVAGSISGFFVALGLVCVALMMLRRKRISRKKRSKAEEEREFPATNLAVYSYKELSAATRGFTEKLGHGGFGAVFRGALPDSTQIAVKRLERPGGGSASSSGDREFRAEVRTIGSVHHVNLVRLHGFCCEGPHRLLVYDFMPNGPLSSYLRRNRTQPPAVPPLSWEARFRIAVGTARGIAYLHEECRDCIIHCDIKPENILLDREYMPKVADFGLARLMGRELSRILITVRGTWGYVAPEWISGVAITPKADVYSYGMTLLELLGGRRNVEVPQSHETGVEEEESWFFPAWAARRIVEGGVGEVVDGALGGRYEAGEAERAGRVAVWCIQDEEGARPAMGDVVKMLEGAVEVGVPPLPQLLQALVAGDSFPRAALASRSSSSGASSASAGEKGPGASVCVTETEMD